MTRAPVSTGIRSVIFDFDYTLADSSAGVFDCINTALVQMGFVAAGRQQADATIGLPLAETFSRLTGNADEPLRAEFVGRFHQRAEVVMVNSTKVFGFVPEMLRGVRDRGISAAVASTKGRKHIEEILERLELRSIFGTIVGGNDVECQKPHPEALFAVMQRLGTSPAESLYIGDSVVDAEAASRAGISFIAVLSGVTPRSAFDSYAAAAVLNDASELPAWLELEIGR
ncbi:MAG: HAD-IA family hydrolase [Candidatus Acidiferrales bacterium]